MRWRFRSRLKSSQHLAAARIHNPGGRFQASCCIRAFGQVRTTAVTFRRSRPKRQTRRSGFVSVLLRLRFLAPAKSESEKAET